MGWTVFTVVFFDGSKETYVARNAVDFIRYPVGKGPGDVTDSPTPSRQSSDEPAMS